MQNSLKDAFEADARLKAMVHDRDIFVSVKTKVILGAAFIVFQFGMGVWIINTFSDGGRVAPSLRPIQGVYFASIIAGFYLVAVAVGWRWGDGGGAGCNFWCRSRTETE